MKSIEVEIRPYIEQLDHLSPTPIVKAGLNTKFLEKFFSNKTHIVTFDDIIGEKDLDEVKALVNLFKYFNYLIFVFL